MKIKTIEIKNYKAFYGEHSFNVDGKNLFIYGENGSGKSSLYYAVKDFFQSSVETINFDDVECYILAWSGYTSSKFKRIGYKTMFSFQELLRAG